ncbi:hypothetical protein MKW94_028460, partial [Papaver nudicaule]|nr:hypothetical protein [Papaver nudicaule]
GVRHRSDLQDDNWEVDSLSQYSLPNLKSILKISSELLKIPRSSTSCVLEYLTPE